KNNFSDSPGRHDMSYTVKPGDNLSLIARVNGTTVATLMRLNPDIHDANRIYPGQRIQLPSGEPRRETRTVGQVADCSECAQEYVDLLHQARKGFSYRSLPRGKKKAKRRRLF